MKNWCGPHAAAPPPAPATLDLETGYNGNMEVFPQHDRCDETEWD